MKTLREQIEERALSGEPFTYGGLCKELGLEGDEDRLIDRTIQRLRKAGRIAFTREGRNVVWRKTEDK